MYHKTYTQGKHQDQERGEAVEHWLREAVASAYDAVKSGQSQTHAASAVFKELRARHAARTASSR